MYANEDWGSENKSPFYPTGFLTSNDVTITPPYYEDILRVCMRRPENGNIFHLRGYLDVYDGDYIELDNGYEDRDYTKFNATTKNNKLF
jgi:hypothetical protein